MPDIISVCKASWQLYRSTQRQVVALQAAYSVCTAADYDRAAGRSDDDVHTVDGRVGSVAPVADRSVVDAIGVDVF